MAQCRTFRSASCGCWIMPSASMATARSSPRALTARLIGSDWKRLADNARRLSQALERAGSGAGRARRHPGDEPRPSSDGLVRGGRHGRGPPHHEPAAVRRPARIYRQPRRGPRAALRPRLRAAGRAHETALDDDHAYTSVSTTSSMPGSVPRTATIAGTRATSASRAGCATPAAPPGTRRACCTSIGPPCSTRCRLSRPTSSTSRRDR